MEGSNRETTIGGVAGNIALQVIGAKPAMARAAVIARRWRCRYFRRGNDQRSPIDSYPELIRHRAGRPDRQIRLRTLEVDHDRKLAFDDFAGRRTVGREIPVSNVWRRDGVTSEHPADSRKMLSSEKYFTVDHIRRYSEDSRVEGLALDAVVEHATLAGRVILEARGPRAGLIKYALDDATVFEVQLALPETLVHEARVGAQRRSALLLGP